MNIKYSKAYIEYILNGFTNLNGLLKCKKIKSFKIMFDDRIVELNQSLFLTKFVETINTNTDYNFKLVKEKSLYVIIVNEVF